MCPPFGRCVCGYVCRAHVLLHAFPLSVRPSLPCPVCVCVCLCGFACAYLSIRLCLSVSFSIPLIYIYIYIYIEMFIIMHVYASTCVVDVYYVCVCVCVCVMYWLINAPYLTWALQVSPQPRLVSAKKWWCSWSALTTSWSAEHTVTWVVRPTPMISMVLNISN